MREMFLQHFPAVLVDLYLPHCPESGTLESQIEATYTGEQTAHRWLH
jgi:hypothetical protein